MNIDGIFLLPYSQEPALHFNSLLVVICNTDMHFLSGVLLHSVSIYLVYEYVIK